MFLDFGLIEAPANASVAAIALRNAREHGRGMDEHAANLPAGMSESQFGTLNNATSAALKVSGTRAHNDHVPRGIGCMVLATMMFSTASALTKWQVGIYPVGEVVFSRSIASFAVCGAVMLPMTGFAVFATRRPRDHIARGLSQATSQTLFALAFTLVPPPARRRSISPCGPARDRVPTGGRE
jgi:hypothetical protein